MASREAEIDECIGEGWAPIKRQYIVPRSEMPALIQARLAAALPPASPAEAATPSAGAGEAAEAASASSAAVNPDGTAAEPASKRRRGQNRARKGEELGFGAGAGSQFCRALIAGKECKFGDKCRDSHNMAQFLATKPADLGPRCYVYDTRGFCPAGVSCRFGDSHTDKATGEQAWTKPSTGADAVPFVEPKGIARLPGGSELNRLPLSVMQALRKSTYPFLEAPAFPVKQQQGGGRGGQGGKSGGGASAGAQAAAAAEAPSAPSDAAPPAAAPAASAPPALAFETGEGYVPLRDKWEGYSVRDARIRSAEKRRIDFTDKLMIAPLTTVGNLPYRRIMKRFGADTTCSEMALASNIVAGDTGEWALLRRHPEEDCFGVQLAGAYPDTMARAAELIERYCEVDFVDINSGCPIDMLCDKGMGAAMMGKSNRIRECVTYMSRVLSCPVTFKMRTGLDSDNSSRFAHKLVHKFRVWSLATSVAGGALPVAGAATPLVGALTLHGRTRQQRYSRYADWDYIARAASCASGDVTLGQEVWKTEGIPEPIVREWQPEPAPDALLVPAAAEAAAPAPAFLPHIGPPVTAPPGVLPSIPLIGNGDVLCWQDWYAHKEQHGVATCLLARGALIKPWLPTEIKERRDWDISSRERLDILRDFVNFGLGHWGSDQSGVNHTRRFLLEWLSFLHRYVPVGLLERLPQRMNDRPPAFVGRDDLETLMASPAVEDWIRLSELLLGRVPDDFKFVPKHKSNSYAVTGEAAQGGGRVGITAAQVRGGGAVVAAPASAVEEAPLAGSKRPRPDEDGACAAAADDDGEAEG